jgi:hypothetical protein
MEHSMNVIQTRPTESRRFPASRLQDLSAVDCTPHDTPHAHLGRQQFDAMCRAFRPHGGFVSGDEVMRCLRRNSERPLSILGRWIASRAVLNVWWRDQTPMPMFQFDLADMSVRPAYTRVAAELGAVFDDRELALWFAAPNAWLDDAAPVALLADDEFAVLQAARTDRFIARG